MVAALSLGLSEVVGFATFLAGLYALWRNYLQRGKLQAPPPDSYGTDMSRGALHLWLPLPLVNLGGSTLVVVGMQATIERESLPGQPVYLEWKRIAPHLKRTGEAEHALPLLIPGGESQLIAAEFVAKHAFAGRTLVANEKLRVLVEYRTLRRSIPWTASAKGVLTSWKPFLEFDWWLPRHDQDSFTIHLNKVGGCGTGPPGAEQWVSWQERQIDENDQ